MNLSEFLEKRPNVEPIKTEVLEVDDSQLELLQHEVPTIKFKKEFSEDEFITANIKTLDPEVISNETFEPALKIFGHNCHVQSHEGIFIKEELLHEELDIKNEDDKNNLGTQLLDPTSIPNTAKPFKCTFCDYSGRQKTTLNRHLRIHTGEKPFKCNICDLCFKRKSHLKCHSIIHTGEKPFKCNYCNQCFGRKSILNNHLKTHTGVKPFKCNVCDYRFGHKSALQSHLRIHTGEKPYKCNICDYCCVQNGTLKIHLRSHTGERPFKCNICGHSSGDKSGLKKHIRTHTGKHK